MNKHTPGPWKVDGSGMNIFTRNESLEFQPMVATASMHDLNLRDCQANARLIAAAPELLEALKIAEQFVAKFEEDDNYTDGQVETISAIRAAIAKATGE